MLSPHHHQMTDLIILTCVSASSTVILAPVSHLSSEYESPVHHQVARFSCLASSVPWVEAPGCDVLAGFTTKAPSAVTAFSTEAALAIATTVL
mmetsp:Transcript_48826/g.127549  ORF Transcript_48826/g.127549 Transcript_48826/m.127549 type:complete len:93 (-) Transcript_48826:329-607(-)